MKRFITYLFTYENGVKEKNVGFIRTTLRDDVCNMEIHIQGMGRYQGKGLIYTMLDRNHPTGIFLGEISVNQGRGFFQTSFRLSETLPDDTSIELLVGIGIRFDQSYYVASCWSDEMPEAFANNLFTEWSKAVKNEELPEVISENPTESVTTQAEKEARGEVTHEAQSELVRLATEKIYLEQESCKEDNLQKIDISDIKKLPKKNWYLCNNSFLIHGFFNYHYLIVKDVEEDGVKKKYLGVPGIYEKPERMMAMLFGFPEFSPEKKTETDSLEGEFGYWLCLLDM